MNVLVSFDLTSKRIGILLVNVLVLFVSAGGGERVYRGVPGGSQADARQEGGVPMSVYLSIFLSIYPPSISLSNIFLFRYLSFCLLSIYLSIHLSYIYLAIYLSPLSVYPFIYLCIYLFIHPYI